MPEGDAVSLIFQRKTLPPSAPAFKHYTCCRGDGKNHPNREGFRRDLCLGGRSSAQNPLEKHPANAISRQGSPRPSPLSPAQPARNRGLGGLGAGAAGCRSSKMELRRAVPPPPAAGRAGPPRGGLTGRRG